MSTYEAKTDDARVLERLLRTTVGINQHMVSAILEDVDNNPEFFVNNPMELYQMLQNAGLSNQRAQNIVHSWLMRKDPTKADIFTFTSKANVSFGGLENKDKIDKFVEMILELKKIEALSNLTSSHKEPEYYKRPDIFERAQESYVIRSIFGDGAGSKPHEVLEMEPIIDEKTGEIKKDEEGRPIFITRRKMYEEERKSTSTDDEFDKWVNKMMKFGMVRMMFSQQPGGYGNLPPSPFMAVELEPVLDSQGKPVLDQFNQPIMKIKQTPIQFNTQQQPATNDKVMDALITALTGAQQAKTELADKLVGVVKESSEKQVQMLQSRLEALEQQDPLDTVTAIIDRLRDLGFGKEDQNVEVAKMNAELKKWMHEQDHALQKWIWEEKQKMKDKEYAKQQMKEFNDTLRLGLTKIGEPLIDLVKEGYIAEKRAGKHAVQKGEVRYQEAPPQQNREKPLEEYTDEELMNLYMQARQSERIIAEAQNKLVAEMKKRGINTPPNEIEP